MGASMSTTPGAETPSLLAKVRPYWFCDEFPRRVAEGLAWPAADQVLAGIAPRHVYVASARNDAPADPTGERAAVDLAREAVPAGSFGYHVRDGADGVIDDEWYRIQVFILSTSGHSQ